MYKEKFSARNSDVAHDLQMQESLLRKWTVEHKFQAAEAYEQMEDFDHKMGLKMRKSNKERVDKQRAAQEQEERTMGLAKAPVPREPSPIQHYEYGPVEAHKSLNLDAVFQHSASHPNSYRGSARSHAARSGASTWRETPRSSLTTANTGIGTTARGISSYSTRRDDLTMHGYPHNHGDLHPGTYGSARGIEIVTHRSMPARLQTARGRLQGLGQGTSDVWTPQSMLEPIFMPISCAQRIVAADDGEMKKVS
jgi:hypothetical protein